MEMEGTEQQIFAAFGVAGLFLSMQILGSAVRRGDLKMADVAAVFESAQHGLADAMTVFPCDPQVKKIADTALKLAAQMTGAYSAEKPPEGPH